VNNTRVIWLNISFTVSGLSTVYQRHEKQTVIMFYCRLLCCSGHRWPNEALIFVRTNPVCLLATFHNRWLNCWNLLVFIWLLYVSIFVVALCNRADHYIFALWFLSSFFFLSFFPNLSGWRLDVYHTSTHGVACANLECMSEICCKRLAENTGCKNSPFWHHRTTLSGCIFPAEACIDNRKKKLVKQRYLPHMSS